MLIVGTVWSQPVRAQLPKALSKSGEPPVQNEIPAAQQDALGRTTPRGTVVGFLTAAYGHNYELASQYLDTRLRGKDAASLAEKLFFVLDRRLPAKLNNLSNDPRGSSTDPLNSRRELVGSIASESGQVDIFLERVDRGSGVSVWLFSRQTLAAVPDVYEEIEALAVENVLPDFMLRKYYGFSVFGWLFFLVGLPLAYLILSLANGLLSFGFGYALRRWKKTPDIPTPQYSRIPFDY